MKFWKCLVKFQKPLKDAFIFMIGAFGVQFFNWVQIQLANMNSTVFAMVGLFFAYCLINKRW